MACNVCWAIPQPPTMRSYLVELVDSVTDQAGLFVMQAECTHGTQEWVQSLADNGSLIVTSPDDENVQFPMSNPVVMNIDDKAAAHIPIVSPVD